VALRTAGRELHDRLTRAVSHLSPAIGDDPAELTIEIWDGASTGVPLPLRYLRDAFDRSWPFGRSVLAASFDDRVIGYQSYGSTLIFDRQESHIAGWFADSADLTLFELGKPMQPLLFAWHSDNDTVPVHAGLVSKGGRGVLLGGAGGSGKSTTSLLCLRGGFEYLGDDYIGIPPASRGTWTGFSFYNSTWLDPNHIGRLSWLEPFAIRGSPTDDKHLVLLSDVHPDRLADSAEIVALFLPRVTGERDTTWRVASSTEAVLRLAPSSILQLPFIEPRSALNRITEVSSGVPTCWLDLGTDLDQIPVRVGEALEAVEIR
jgi:hypothetical protein